MLSQIHQIWSRLKRSLSGGDRRRLELISLDDWTLLELLDRIPLIDLLRLGQTNHRLRDLVEWNYRHSPNRCAISLVIGVGIDCSGPFKSNTIRVPRLTRTFIESLLKLQLDITSLELIVNTVENIELLFMPIRRYANQLKYLSVNVFEVLEAGYSIGPLIRLVNRMRCLEKLDLSYRGMIPGRQWRQHLRLPIICQLESFRFFSYNDASRMLRQLLRHADVTKMKRVDLRSSFIYEPPARRLLDLHPRLAATFESLQLIFPDLGFNQLCRLFDHFPSICHVKLAFVYLNVAQLNVALQRLPKLTDLYLIIDFPMRSQFREDPDASEAIGEEILPETTDPRDLVPLNNVTRLFLDFNLRNHYDFSSLHLDTLFPNLTSIYFYNITCRTCKYLYMHHDEEKMIRKLICIEKLLNDYELFPKLQTVACNEYFIEDESSPSPPPPPPPAPSKLQLHRRVLLNWYTCLLCLFFISLHFLL